MSNSLRNVFKSNRAQDSTLKWQYLASNEGAMQLYPGTQWRHQYKPNPNVDCKAEVPPGTSCPSFDPRIRPWYVSAAAGSKSLVVILDVSSSMGNKQRMEIAVAAAVSVIDGLSANDRLALIFFSDVAFTCTSIGDKMLHLTPENRKLFKKCILNITPFGQTNFENAFNLAFKLFDYDKVNNQTCNNVIIFLTDGEKTSGAAPEELIREKNKEFGAKIFTFSLGGEADVETAKKIACENGGLWKQIEDGNFNYLRTQMASYYEYLSYRYGENDAIVWSAIYNDTTGLGELSTASIACFTKDDGRLLGVAAVDVPVGLIRSFPDGTNLIQQLIARGTTCPSKYLPDSFVARLRGGECNYCTCPSKIGGIAAGTSVGIVLLIGLIVGIIVIILLRKYLRKRRWSLFRNRLQQELATSTNTMPLNQLNAGHSFPIIDDETVTRLHYDD